MEITDQTIRFGRKMAVEDGADKDYALRIAKREVDEKISQEVGMTNFEAEYRFHKLPKPHNEAYLPREYSFVLCEAYVNTLKEKS